MVRAVVDSLTGSARHVIEFFIFYFFLSLPTLSSLVQFDLSSLQMLQELNDLVDKKLFTQKEVKHIMKKRTAFETTLIRRVAKKADYLRYITYEMGLEQLRRKRVDRMSKVFHWWK